jgi:hypothetical protein
MISTDKLHFKILAPTFSGVPRHFKHPRVDRRTHNDLIFGIQLLRGLALRECGQMSTQLLSDGRHFQQADFESWHVLLLNGEDRLLGCARYRPLKGGVEEFGASHSALAQSHHYGPMLKSAMERLISNVKTRDKQYGEAGGWALRPEVRGSTAAVNVALMTFALAEHLDAGLALTTATTNHHSSSILCRIGANRVAELPAYYEPKYGSMIELLHFNLPNENPRYATKLGKIRTQTLEVPVICATDGTEKTLPSSEHGYTRLRVDSHSFTGGMTPAETIQ